MRITHNMLFNSAILDMNNALLKLSTAQEQSNTQKRINRPSDDPAGYAESRRMRDILSTLDAYKDNAGLAESWLSLADSTLLQTSTVLTSVKELAEQASTGTLTAEDRMNVATQVRELFGELLNLSNTSTGGDSIFAGHHVDQNAFAEVLYVSVQDDTLTQDDVVSVTGDSDLSVLVEFTQSGVVGGAADIEYRYTTDGGDTWTTDTLAAGDQTLVLDGCAVTLENGAAVTLTTDDDTGTRLVVRPSALYLGDDNDGATVSQYGSSPVSGQASGVFSSNVLVRVDGDTDLASTITYSYSTDNGATWVEGNTADTPLLSVPGGFLELSPDGGITLNDGDQFSIVPNTANITLEMSPGGEVVINNVGKDVFGGLYQAAGASNAAPAFGDDMDRNMFETVGDLIGCLETNNMDGVAEALERLSEVHQHIEDAAADVGGRENRLEYATYTLEETITSLETRLSNVEDADLSELLIDVSRYQYAYQSVLSTTSKILKLNLLSYI